MKRVLVTGAAGFIGRFAVAHLSRMGYEVHAADRREGSGDATWHAVNLLDEQAVTSLIDEVKPTHLLHLAWGMEQGKLWDSPANLDWAAASARLFRAFVAAGGERAAFAGSCAEYDWTHEKLVEDKTPSQPRSLYGVCKNALREMVEGLARHASVSAAWGRIFFLYGPGEAPGRLVPSLVDSLKNGKPAIVRSGQHVRDFLHVDDVGRALAMLLDSKVSGIVNIASGKSIKLADLGQTVAEIIGRPDLLKIENAPGTADNPLILEADVSRLSALGFRPRYTLADGLEQVIAGQPGNGG